MCTLRHGLAPGKARPTEVVSGVTNLCGAERLMCAPPSWLRVCVPARATIVAQWARWMCMSLLAGVTVGAADRAGVTCPGGRVRNHTSANPSSTAIPHPPSPTSPPHHHRHTPRSTTAVHPPAMCVQSPCVFQCLALTFCLPSDTGRDAHPCRCASVCRAERSSMPTPGESR